MSKSQSSNSKFQLISDSATLSNWCQSLRSQGHEKPYLLAVDTEFTRRDTYFPQLNLIQVSANSLPIALIDVQSSLSLAPLCEIFADAEVILHSGSQDYTLLDGIGLRPMRYLDTQLAYAFQNEASQVSYQNLAQSLLGVSLDKSSTQSDWSARPLSDEQLTYASEDVEYLTDIHSSLTSSLSEEKQRWYLEECTAQYLPSEGTHPESAWHKVGALHLSNDRELAAGQALAAWRERIAISLDVPKKWIFDDDTLLVMAKHRSLARGIQKQRYYKRYLGQNNLLAELKSALESLPEEPAHARIKPRKPSASDKAAINTLKTHVASRCEAQQVAVSLVANREDYQKAMLNPEQSRLTQGWRAELLGDLPI